MLEMRSIWTATLLAVFAISAGCSSVKVRTDFDTAHDFSGYGSYAWLPDPPAASEDPRLHNPLIDSRVRQAVNAQLAAKGFRYSSVEGADFLVTYYLGLETKIDVDTVHASYGYGYGYRGWYGPGRTYTTVREYEQGTLLVDILDPDGPRLVWRGSGSARVSERSTPEQSSARINEAVGKMLENFPPQAP